MACEVLGPDVPDGVAEVRAECEEDAGEGGLGARQRLRAEGGYEDQDQDQDQPPAAPNLPLPP